MHQRSVFVLLLVALASPANGQENTRPYVAAFERFHRSGSEHSDAGRLLLGELNCTSCHAAGDLKTEAFRAAPNLRDVGARANPYFLRDFILEPDTYQSMTTMPAVMNDISEEQRTADATAIVQYLLTLQNRYEQVPPDAAAVDRGKTLYHSIGCVACHDPDDPKVVAMSREFPKLEQKYSHRGLEQFLRDPLAVRPSGRMPHMNLQGREASDIAHYLLRRTVVQAPLKYEVFNGRRRNLKHDVELELAQTGNANGFDLKFPHRGSNYTARLSGFIRIETAGKYTFHLSADDGAQLAIGDRQVIDNDSPRSTDRVRTASGEVNFTKGVHPISVLYFQRGRQQSLKLEWEGPEIARAVVPASVLSNQKESVEAYRPWKIDKEEAKRGEGLFVKHGCNNCHNLQPSESLVGIPALASLDPSNGCLAVDPPKSVPHYGLEASQQTALAAAIKSLGAAKEQTPDSLIAETMQRLNCYACHDRDQIGGVEEARSPLFVGDSIELGDEGRLPPSITNVGDKLQKTWLTEVLANKGIARPYMAARMPQFGSRNVAHLPDLFVKADRNETSLAGSSDAPTEAKATALRLIDKGKLQCIACHDFNGHESVGLRAMDLTKMPTRLNRDWFHRYMLNPSQYRPGTKMPASWPRGRSLFKDELDGDAFRQIDAIWMYLSDGRKAIPPKGLNRKSLELIVGGETVVYRNKIREAGFRGICVGHPEQVNLSFDAATGRLTQIWKGRFLNVSPHWNRQGMGRIGPLGTDVITFPKGSPLAVVNVHAREAWPEESGREAGYRFKGYDLDKLQRPTFRYTYNGLKVGDYTTATEKGERRILTRQMTIEGPAVDDLWLRVWSGDESKREDGSYLCGKRTPVRIGGSTISVRRKIGGQQELLVPVIFEKNKAEFTVTYEW